MKKLEISREKTYRGEMDALSLHMADLGNFPMVSVGPENFFKLGSDNEDRIRIMIEGNLRLSFGPAKEYETGDPFIDNLQEAHFRLVKAARKYDPEMGVKFSTYSREVMKYHFWNQVGKVRRRRRFYIVPFDISELPEEKTQNVSDEKYQNPKSENPLSLLLKKENRVELEQALDRLPVKEEKVLRMCFGLDSDPPLTQEAIGKKMGYTGRAMVSLIYTRGLKKLREDPELRRAFSKI